MPADAMQGEEGRRPERSPRRHRWSTIERDLRVGGGDLIAGVDEVGRGSLAGPVVACAVVMPPEARAIPGVDDSKQLTARQRERLCARILERALDVRVAAASSREIDRINIYHASVLAMRRALAGLRLSPHHVLVDGRAIRTLGFAHTAIVHGDARCFNIACASIVAKVTRDRLMSRLAKRHPAYRWERNCGYTTAAHVVAIVENGVTAHHRRTFIVKALTANLDESTSADHAIELEMVHDLLGGDLQLDDAAPHELAEGALIERTITDALQMELDATRAMPPEMLE